MVRTRTLQAPQLRTGIGFRGARLPDWCSSPYQRIDHTVGCHPRILEALRAGRLTPVLHPLVNSFPKADAMARDGFALPTSF